MRRIGMFGVFGQIGGRIGGLPHGRGGCPLGRNTSSTSAQFCQIVGASLPMVPPEAGEFSARKVSQELKSNACWRLGRSNGGTAVTVHGSPLVRRPGVIGASGLVTLQFVTGGSIGGAGVGAGVFFACGPPATGANNPKAHTKIKAGENRLFTVQSLLPLGTAGGAARRCL